MNPFCLFASATRIKSCTPSMNCCERRSAYIHCWLICITLMLKWIKQIITFDTEILHFLLRFHNYQEMTAYEVQVVRRCFGQFRVITAPNKPTAPPSAFLTLWWLDDPTRRNFLIRFLNYQEMTEYEVQVVCGCFGQFRVITALNKPTADNLHLSLCDDLIIQHEEISY